MNREELNELIRKNVRTNNKGEITAVILSGVLYNMADYSDELANALRAALLNYYLKGETYSRAEVNEIISTIKQFRYVKVPVRPVASEQTLGIIYLVPSESPDVENVCDEWITVEDGEGGYDWELIGSTAVDMDGYVTEDELELELLHYVPVPEEITHAQLLALAHEGLLRPGQYYRIIDYVCTTVKDGTSSGGHQFDIVVRAISRNALSEQAQAVHHDGEDYFAACNLAAWEVRYCIENDTTRFDWADAENGKGVIYKLVDEFGNSFPFDGKNIMFHKEINGEEHDCYVFSLIDNGGVMHDATVYYSNEYHINMFAPRNNVIDDTISDSESYDPDEFSGYGNIHELRDVVFFGDFRSEDISYPWKIAPTNCHIGNSCENILFMWGDGVEILDIKIGDICCDIVFKGSANGIEILEACHDLEFGDYVSNIKIGSGCYGTSFGDESHDIAIGNSCHNNTFGTSDANISIGNGCYGNTFANSNSDITLGVGCNNNTLAYGCGHVILEGGNTSCSLSSSVSRITIGGDTTRVSIGANSKYIDIGGLCSDITIGNSCTYISFGFRCRNVTMGKNCKGLKFGQDVYQIRLLKNTTGTAGDYIWYCEFEDHTSFIDLIGEEIAGIHVLSNTGGRGTSSRVVIQGYGAITNTYNTPPTFVANNANNEIKIFNIADLV